MRTPIELVIDVTEAAGLGTPAHTAVTLFLPDEGALADPPAVCFGFPGGGYNRRYYAFDMPDSAGRSGEAGYHCERGWIFAACDSLGFGDATAPEPHILTLDAVAAANDATVRTVMARLADGTLAAGLAPIANAAAIGIGQSMGGCFTIVAQGQHATFDGVGILGSSAIHTVVPMRPGEPPAVAPWITRSSRLDNPEILNMAAFAAAGENSFPARLAAAAADPSREHPFLWSFHYDDEPAEVVALDMAASAGKADPLPPWRSATAPLCGAQMLTPGVVAGEAAAIAVPVLIGVGERDVVPDPWAEPKAYKSATDVSLFVCPRMSHMHNFAHTRFDFWRRIHAFGSRVAAAKAGR
jgi:pimeloyl-ACP methyl ester carboxylesterase